MIKKENDLEPAYLSGLEASLWWGKFTEFLYATNEGETIRKELQKDYLAWQVKELGRDPAKGLLEWQMMFKKLFPDMSGSDETKSERNKNKKKKKGGSSVHKSSKLTAKNNGSGAATKTKKEIKFKNIK